MGKNDPSKPATGGIARGDPEDPYRYRMPAAEVLKAEVEKSLCLTIQKCDRAIARLSGSVSPGIARALEETDFDPVPGGDVQELMSDELPKTIAAVGARLPGTRAFVTKLREGLSTRLYDHVESHREKFDGLWQRFPEWIADRLCPAALLQVVPSWTAEQKKLWLVISKRDGAINKLVEDHMPLAKRFAQSAMRRADEFDDLMNEGALILRRCAELFDPDCGNRFSSYAMKALRELKRRAPSHGTTRYTAHQVVEADRVENQGARETGGDDRLDPLVELATNPKTRREIDNARRLLAVRQRPAERDNEGEREPIDERYPSPFEEVAECDFRERLLVAFGHLGWLAKKVLVGKSVCGQSFRAMGLRYQKSPDTLSKIYDQSRSELARQLDPDRKLQRPR